VEPDRRLLYFHARQRSGPEQPSTWRQQNLRQTARR
jgi:hypothetical protein